MTKDNYSGKFAEFYKKYKRMPSYAEIMELFGYRSKNAAFKLVNKLVEAGVINKDKQGRLSPANIFGEIKVLGYIEAGFPTLVEEEVLHTRNLDDWLVTSRDSTYLLQVRGDSMIEAGIMNGDTVIADRSRPAKNGDIVIAEVDGGWTMKYLKKTGSKVELLPANKNYKPITPRHDLNIAAVVTSVIRKY
ncbi:repressor LexA [Candidatus Giovannonibacteria bacterium RIFCSPHIGHO2_02_43_13]|uniref:Repressor LexA n=1 Tax=Candidatus Giovannonibacteria bacterium RIFCSPHIGHO2_02_43_13 TaxID=1798330 RepID=A0A1F5WPM9_9BACT|nr:MAG: repressor LexA [Candidatus Giovannonibacteria bacterium RIFCSPHIGHO2_02_43_13]